MAREVALPALLLILSWNSSARANGRFPTAGQVVFDPSDENHVLVRSTFGLIDVDQASGFGRWTCEQALGLSGQEDPMWTISANGSAIGATTHGVLTRSDVCNAVVVPDFDGAYAGDLTLDQSNPHRVLLFTVKGLPKSQFDSQIWQSVDDGTSFTALGSALPPELLPLSIDVAPSDPTRVYLTARKGSDDGYVSVLLVSSDGGATFGQTNVPETSSLRLAFIGAVHPQTPDVVYLRVSDPAGDVLWISNDSGVTLNQAFTGIGKMLGFAVSPDGEQIAFGGPSDGLWSAAADGSMLTQRSDFTPSCLAWRADGLYACSDAASSLARAFTRRRALVHTGARALGAVRTRALRRRQHGRHAVSGTLGSARAHDRSELFAHRRKRRRRRRERNQRRSRQWRGSERGRHDQRHHQNGSARRGVQLRRARSEHALVFRRDGVVRPGAAALSSTAVVGGANWLGQRLRPARARIRELRRPARVSQPTYELSNQLGLVRTRLGQLVGYFVFG